MFDHFRISEVSIPLGIFVLALLLFPAPHGSFVATHGPVTALRSLRTATATLLSLSALHILLTIRGAAMRQAIASAVFGDSFNRIAPDREQNCSLLC